MRRPVGVKSILWFFRWTRFFSGRVGHCRHASIRTLEGAIGSLRCRLGVLGSAGAAICLAPCGSALRESRTWARPLTQSPELGFGFDLYSLPGTVLIFCFVFRSTRLPASRFDCCCATVRTLLRSPTGDAATPPAFWPWPRWLASCRSCRRARPALAPNA